MYKRQPLSVQHLSMTFVDWFNFFIGTVASYHCEAMWCNPLVRTVASYHREALWRNSISVDEQVGTLV